jgi:hypothetical protein
MEAVQSSVDKFIQTSYHDGFLADMLQSHLVKDFCVIGDRVCYNIIDLFVCLSSFYINFDTYFWSYFDSQSTKQALLDNYPVITNFSAIELPILYEF